MSSKAFQLVAGHPALDFANTLDGRYTPGKTVDLLGGYQDLASFCRQAGLLTESEAEALVMGTSELERAEALEAAREFREALHRIFDAQATARPISGDDLSILNGRLSEAAAHRIVREREGSLVWSWEGLDRAPAAPLWVLALGAAELLTSGDLARVRECQAESCRWLFLDLSKNHSRRWCDMKSCGNRIKARRYYRKHADNG